MQLCGGREYYFAKRSGKCVVPNPWNVHRAATALRGMSRAEAQDTYEDKKSKYSYSVSRLRSDYTPRVVDKYGYDRYRVVTSDAICDLRLLDTPQPREIRKVIATATKLLDSLDRWTVHDVVRLVDKLFFRDTARKELFKHRVVIDVGRNENDDENFWSERRRIRGGRVYDVLVLNEVKLQNMSVRRTIRSVLFLVVQILVEVLCPRMSRPQGDSLTKWLYWYFLAIHEAAPEVDEIPLPEIEAPEAPEAPEVAVQRVQLSAMSVADRVAQLRRMFPSVGFTNKLQSRTQGIRLVVYDELNVPVIIVINNAIHIINVFNDSATKQNVQDLASRLQARYKTAARVVKVKMTKSRNSVEPLIYANAIALADLLTQQQQQRQRRRQKVHVDPFGLLEQYRSYQWQEITKWFKQEFETIEACVERLLQIMRPVGSW